MDTLTASADGGPMVYIAVQKKNSEASLEENAAYIEYLIPQHCIWFTVDDLEYSKRGGRVSTSAGRRSLRRWLVNAVRFPTRRRTHPF